MLSPRQIEQFTHDGFVVVEDFVAAGPIAELRARALELVDAWEPTDERTVFTTHADERRSNREFLSSGSGVWCFLEPEAVTPEGRLSRPKAESVNKIGHALHDLDPVVERFTYTARLAAVAADVGLADPLAIQSMYIFKQPGIGGEVTCHQDATFLATEPDTVTGFWFAVDDATVDNGCLWVAPGAHRGGLRERFRRAGAMTDDDDTEFELLDATPLPAAPDDLVPVEAPSGTLVVLHGRLPHWSDANRSPHSRHAYTLHCVSASARYPAWNWLRRPPELPFRRLDEVAARLDTGAVDGAAGTVGR